MYILILSLAVNALYTMNLLKATLIHSGTYYYFNDFQIRQVQFNELKRLPSLKHMIFDHAGN